MECKVGTPGYQAPEVSGGSYVTTAIDIWAFGVILHELITSNKPLFNDNTLSMTSLNKSKADT